MQEAGQGKGSRAHQVQPVKPWRLNQGGEHLSPRRAQGPALRPIDPGCPPDLQARGTFGRLPDGRFVTTPLPHNRRTACKTDRIQQSKASAEVHQLQNLLKHVGLMLTVTVGHVPFRDRNSFLRMPGGVAPTAREATQQANQSCSLRGVLQIRTTHIQTILEKAAVLRSKTHTKQP